ncbi:MAG TPA: putative peptide modification system cyclase, partial [Arenimonas sp.]|nr:putative peptide modification system cyclase [Arenimonas sp.]
MDTTTSPPAQRQPPAAITPLLRSVVLCDLVDSTALAERIGDVRIAELMQAHDRLLLRLLLDHQGQLIDKADGVLALFERPVNAAAFALAYQRGLRDLGQQLGQPLQARVGIHVGDVMTWTHTPTEVLAGAKPVEVEGLAKPVAARLMGLALPGQILMSGMAQNLAQRAQGELGHIAPKLLWRLHGRYRFKGVPAPMLVHEVGELGIAPLRPPVSTEKAWRELPLWRKPPVLALEVVLAVSLAVGGVWSMLKSPPAIAFSERDWVVVADFNNLTGETLYDEALDTALRVGLEQSRYVNVLSDLQVEQALKRMQREGQRVDRQIGAEIALREGAKAFVLPTVALAGGRPRLSIELIDPASGVTVHTQMHDSADHQGVVGALDEALRSLRAGLGEPLSHIQKVSLPLEQVTTPSLEALRAYGLGRQAQRESRSSDAKALFEQAVLLDPGFAMAHVALGKLLRNAGDQAGFSASLATAKGLEARLSQRERLLLAAELAWDKDPQTRQAAWRGLTAVFP